MAFFGIKLLYPMALVIAPAFIIIMIILLKRTFIKFKDRRSEEEWYSMESSRNKLNAWTGIMRAIAVCLLVIAIASPYALKQITIPGDQKITILSDESESFQIFDRTIAQRLRDQLNEYFPANLRTIATGEKSAIGDGILSAVRGNDNILLVSDGNVNTGRELGSVALYAASVNSTINAVNLVPLKKDLSLKVSGPRKTVADVDNKFTAEIGNPSNLNYRLIVEIDGRVEVDETSNFPEIYFSRKFGRGVHKMVAKIEVNDEFSENNIFYKTIEVVDKPNILFISRKPSPLKNILPLLYNVDETGDVPANLGNYHAVILNDIPQLSTADVDRLSNYVIDGNGLFVIGGENSYDFGKYEASYFETMLPVKVGVAGDQEGKVNTFILIDISGSTKKKEGISITALDIQKAQAINILNDFRENDNVGVIAFNVRPFVISQLGPLTPKKAEVIDVIERLEFGGGTLISEGIQRAVELLESVPGSNNIVIISDGKTKKVNEAIGLAEEAAAKGIRVYTVGVGSGTHESNMQEIANAGKGIYFKADQSSRLRILFGRPPETEGKVEAAYNLVVMDDSHFIGKNLNLSAKIGGFNQVVPKSAAQLIAATEDGHSILIVWRFGLGRIATLATDDGSKYAGQLLSPKNSQLITRTINWAVGDLNRRKSNFVEVADTHIDRPVEITVRSENEPRQEGLTFSKIEKDTYTAQFNPKEIGFTEILGKTVAVNYNTEYRDIGVNPDLAEVVSATGGKMLDPNDVKQIVDQIKISSKRVKTDNVYYRWQFIVAALIIFLVELFGRRVMENRYLYK